MSEFSAPIIPLEASVSAVDTPQATGLRARLGKIAAVCLLTGAGALAAFTAEEVVQPVAAYADSLGYPWPTDAEAPCEFAPNGGGSCAKDITNPTADEYDWGVYDSNGVFQPYRNGYEYRNCTDYVQWKEGQKGATVPTGLGNGGQWYSSNLIPASERSLTPKAWDAAVKPGNPGHVAFVESVNSVDPNNAGNDNITVSEYNEDGKGDGDTRTGTASSMGFTEYLDFGVHPPDGTPPPPTLRLAARDTSGAYYTKENALNTAWVAEYPSSVTQGMQSGSLTGVVEAGNFLVKQGALDSAWTTEDTGVTQAALSDTYGTYPMLIGELKNSTFYAKDGVGNAWVTEFSGASSIYVGGDRLGVIDTTGTFWVKEGLNGTWVNEHTQATQAALSGTLTGVVVGGTYYVKQGALDSAWTTEDYNVATPLLSDTTANTPLRIGELLTNGTLKVKEAGLSTAWITEDTAVTQATISGNLISELKAGTLNVKQGPLGAAWVYEYTGSVGGVVWGV